MKKSIASGESRWKAGTTDDPITDWNDDIIGRAGVVELLAEHALHLGTPIVALRAGLGDGKTSVLNLFRNAIEKHAIVVSFNAWLPGSEATLATDLFKDIAAECRKHIFVPELRRQALAFARVVSGSVGYLSGLKELIPTRSQRDELQELRNALSRLPSPVVVLLDEIDRMQKEELLVLLKILRGAPSLPNVTFVCAFSEEEVEKIAGESSKYLEKFFPVSVNLSPPPPEMVGRCWQNEIRQRLDEQRWFTDAQDEANFSTQLAELWTDTLQRICTNLRKAGLLLNDIVAASGSIVGEVNPLDLVAIQAIGRFYPQIYHKVRTNRAYLTDAKRIELFTKQEDSEAFFRSFNQDIDACQEPAAVRELLTWLFPEYERAGGRRFGSRRPFNDEIAEVEKRICNSNYFQIYFRSAVPEEMFSNADLNQILSDLNETTTEADAKKVFNTMLDSIPPGHPKREDFLWKVARRLGGLHDVPAEHLAYAVAERAADYRYGILNSGEGPRALNVVFTVAQSLAAGPKVQRVLLGAINRASADTFAVRLLAFTEDRSRNRILTNFSHVDVSGLKKAFVERMRERYQISGDGVDFNIARIDWLAFRRWVQNSDDDRRLEQEFWRRFIGRSRKRLAQAINVIFPGGVSWDSDPKPMVNELLPITEIEGLLQNLPNDDQLDQAETDGIARMDALLQGRFNPVSGSVEPSA
jgi:hypothetical protein